MKAILGLLVVVIIAVGAWWYVQNANPHQVVASGHPQWTPIMYAKDGVIVGAGPDLVAKIFADIGLTATFPESGTWDEVQAKARSGEVDVLVAAYKTDERLTYMEYSDAYTTDPVAVFVKKGKMFPFVNNQDLVGKKGIAMVGDSYGQTFDDYAAKNLTLARATTNTEAFDAIQKGEADYFVYSLFAGEDYLKKNNAVSTFDVLPKYVDEPNFYITISKKSPLVKYLPQVNAGIAKYKADGTIDALIAKYKAE